MRVLLAALPRALPAAPSPATRLFSRAMSFKTTSDAKNYITLAPANPTAAVRTEESPVFGLGWLLTLAVVMKVVFLHGLGDTAHGWADAMAMLAKDLTHIKFILPTGGSNRNAMLLQDRLARVADARLVCFL